MSGECSHAEGALLGHEEVGIGAGSCSPFEEEGVAHKWKIKQTL